LVGRCEGSVVSGCSRRIRRKQTCHVVIHSDVCLWNGKKRKPSNICLLSEELRNFL
jgi:hypothetical protein